MATGELVELLSSSLVQRHLLPRLCLDDLVSLENVSTAFRHHVRSAPEEAWAAAITRSVPPSHHLARVQTGLQQASRKYLATQSAIRTRDFAFELVTLLAKLLENLVVWRRLQRLRR